MKSANQYQPPQKPTTPKLNN